MPTITTPLLAYFWFISTICGTICMHGPHQVAEVEHHQLPLEGFGADVGAVHRFELHVHRLTDLHDGPGGRGREQQDPTGVQRIAS